MVNDARSVGIKITQTPQHVRVICIEALISIGYRETQATEYIEQQTQIENDRTVPKQMRRREHRGIRNMHKIARGRHRR